jgi:tRNA(Ile)-lysidine synthase
LPSTFIRRVAEQIERYQMLAPAQRIGVAVSGGADSVVLLYILHRLRVELACELVVLHVNHHLRGAESEADEEFVQKLADELGLPFLVEQAAAPTANAEQPARDIRRSFFQCAMREHGLHRVALGHTRSDQAETVLFRLLRGSGLTGLAGMRHVTKDNLIRPLLGCSREEIRDWARSEAIEWREDSSNLSTAFTRNRLRIETLPELTSTYNPNLENMLAQSAELAQAEESYWEEEIEPAFARFASRTRFGLEFSADDIISLHLAARRRLMRRALVEVRGDLRAIQFEHVESILRLCDRQEGHDRVIIPGVDALRSFGRLLLSRVGVRGTQERDYQIDLTLGQECILPFQSGVLLVDWLKLGKAPDICANFKKEQDQTIEIIDWDSDLLAPEGTLPSLCVRNWRPGDALQQVGHQSAEKIKALFQMERVLLWERKHWPVVLAGERMVWARQFGGSATINASVGSRNIIRLVYRQP